ncbi:NAD(P)/FAD-dependent oxidoreductase [Amycolatopsis taiwanensis]|uniref:Ferredoxin reductase n=1 Tax=Amycolatopsis taiwanensis TaxID=342230 RepID=A0A9W6R9M1_9PSEU|nr:FAD-dependent oxidoreductase [Amycolatopsis taiwanensis]GLY70785.1 ferredoxin reductase [Amycolatopsis taiwanensis]
MTANGAGLHVAIVGASLAGVRAAASLRQLGFEGRLTLIDAEPGEPYDRPPLSKGFLAQTLDDTAVRLRDASKIDATWIRGRRAINASTAERTLDLDDDTTVGFDGLIIATGSRPRSDLQALVPGTGGPPAEVHVLRSLNDATRLRRALSRPGIRVAVIGAGFIGTEIAATARRLGHAVSLIDQSPVPLRKAVGPTVGGYVAALHRDHGVDLHLGTQVRALDVRHNGRISGVVLDDDTVIPADLVVLGLGAIPNVEWLHHSGALLDDGVRTDAQLRVRDTSHQSIPGIVAAGDIARWPHPLFDDEPVRLEHWSNAADHAAIAARTVLADLVGEAAPEVCASVPSFWSDQYDRKVMSVGLPHLGEDSAVLDGRIADDRFVVGFGRRGRLVGAVGVGSPRTLARYRRLIARQSSWPVAAADPETGPSATGPMPGPASSPASASVASCLPSGHDR